MRKSCACFLFSFDGTLAEKNTFKVTENGTMSQMGKYRADEYRAMTSQEELASVYHFSRVCLFTFRLQLQQEVMFHERARIIIAV